MWFGMEQSLSSWAFCNNQRHCFVVGLSPSPSVISYLYLVSFPSFKLGVYDRAFGCIARVWRKRVEAFNRKVLWSWPYWDTWSSSWSWSIGLFPWGSTKHMKLRTSWRVLDGSSSVCFHRISACEFSLSFWVCFHRISACKFSLSFWDTMSWSSWRVIEIWWDKELKSSRSWRTGRRQEDLGVYY